MEEEFESVSCEFCGEACYLGDTHPCCVMAEERGDTTCMACETSKGLNYKHKQHCDSDCVCSDAQKKRRKAKK